MILGRKKGNTLQEEIKQCCEEGIAMTSRIEVKDPMNWRVWIRFIILYILLVPWYFPKGISRVLVMGIPLWAFMIIFFLVCLVLCIIDVTRNHWDLEAFIESKDRNP